MEHIVQTVSFPGLGIEEFSLDRVAFTLFGHPIYWYGIIFAAAFLCGITYILKRARLFGLDDDRVLDVIIGAVIGGVIGARIYYVVFMWDQYKDNLSSIFKLWEGGIAMYGGVIGGAIAALLMCKIRKVRLIPFTDAAVGGLILGQAIGRWGNFVNVEAFGSVTDLPWRMCSPQAAQFLLRQQEIDQATADQIIAGTLGVHPTFFYESAWCLITFVILFLWAKHRRFDGELTLLYLFLYGAERAVVEGLRTDSLMWGTVRVSQALAAILVVFSAVVWLVIRARIRKSDDPDYLKLYVNTEEGQAVVNGTFYQKASQEESDSGSEEPADGLETVEAEAVETGAVQTEESVNQTAKPEITQETLGEEPQTTEEENTDERKAD